MSKTEILRRFEERSTYVRGKAVVVDGRIKGVTNGLDQDGFLLLRTDAGMQTIMAGGIR
jgi:biotin-(acetyl-CoA carboxylase) ligase